MKVAITHDSLVARGGSERAVLSIARAFPDAPIITGLYSLEDCYPEFAAFTVRPLWVNRFAALRKRPRLLLPFLGSLFRRTHVDADVVVCSTTGFAEHITTNGKKLAYCYSPHPALYPNAGFERPWRRSTRRVMLVLQRQLVRQDQAAAATVARYVSISTEVQRRVKAVYGVDSEVLFPPVTLEVAADTKPIAGIEPGFYVCIGRLLPYKNVDAIVAAFAELPDRRLVVVGTGAEEAALRAAATPNVRFAGAIDDTELRWLYEQCRGVIAAAHEDFGLTPIEAAAFGRATIALKWGGYLDTVEDGRTGVFFDAPKGADIAAAVRRYETLRWDEAALRRHAATFGEEAFIERLRGIVAEMAEA